MVVIGGSGSMKTNSAIDIFKKMDNTFTKLYVVCRNEDEPLYQFIKKKLPKDQLEIIEVIGDDLSVVPKLNTFKKGEHKLFIFDDLCLVAKQKELEEFFIRARKLDISCMYLTQSYFECPKTIRGNCNFVLFKKITTNRDLRVILREYDLGVGVDQLTRLYEDCTQKKLDWLMICVDDPDPRKRFWHNYQKITDVQYEDRQGNVHDVKPEDESDQESEKDDDSEKEKKDDEKEDGKGADAKDHEPSHDEKLAFIRSVMCK